MRWWSVLWRVAVLAAATLLLGACGDDGDGADATTLTFYRPPTVLDDGTPGEVLDSEPLPLDASLPGTGQRITYVSTTPSGDLVPVTGVLIEPSAPPPPDGYPVVVWAHGTTGIGDDCAPSGFTPFELFGADRLLEAGYAIAAPDYQGLGVPGEIHPYLVGGAEGRNVLDAARAASTIDGGPVVVAWGWSQGGHAALFAADLADEYAPELDLRGAAAHAPVTDVGVFLVPGVTDEIVFPYTAEAILAWSEVYDELDLTDLVEVADAEAARLAQQACTSDISRTLDRPLSEVFRGDPANVDSWQAALDLHSVDGTRIEVPVIVAHGDADDLVPIAGTTELVDTLCASGVATRALYDPTWDHPGAMLYGAPGILDWIADRVEGEPAPDDCPGS